MEARPKPLDVTWDKVLEIWWALLWRDMLCGVGAAVGGGVVGGIFGGLLAPKGLAGAWGGTFGSILAFGGYVYFSVTWALTTVLNYNFGQFRNAVAVDFDRIAEATWQEALAVFWSLFWRRLLVAVASTVLFGVTGGVLAHMNPAITADSFFPFYMGGSFIASVITGPWIIKSVWRLTYKEFKIVLLPRGG